MQYIIDGHNLIGKLTDISLDDPNDEALLVQKLMGFVARTRRKCVVIFDHGLPGGASRMSTSGVKVLFAAHDERADDVIMRRIRKEKNPTMWTVVSSDNEVLDSARRHRLGALKSAEFAAILRRPPPPPQPDVSEAADVKLSADEIDEWLDLFGGKAEK